MLSYVLMLFVGSFPKEERERKQGENAAHLYCKRSLEEKRRLPHCLSSCSETSRTCAMSTSFP